MPVETVILGGSVAQRPGYGGHTWVFLQYLLGFKDLGFDVVFVDRLEPEMCFDADGRPCPPRQAVGCRYLEEVLRRSGIGDAFALLYDEGRQSLGMSREQLLEKVSTSALFLNVNGFVDDEEVLGRAPLTAFLDIDPGLGQMWRELGLHDPFTGHDVYVTIGENIGRPGCEIPTCGIDWVTTPQPVVLDLWPAQAAGGGAFTSVASWRGPYAPIEYEGVTYGLRVHEFRRFAEVPRRSRERFEVALDIDQAEVKDLDLLRENGWSLADPKVVAGDPWTYQRYVQGSKAEFTIAKALYVQTQSGWFSDRSICYLASGKPVIAQDTGFGRLYPEGEGLFAFDDPDEALAAVEETSNDYLRHAHAARALAEEHFDSRKVLSRLLTAVGAT